MEKIGSASVYVGDCLESLRTMPDKSVHCCVTSPPYWGLRDYGTARWDGGDAECDHRNGPLASPKSTLQGYTGPTVKLATGGMPYRDTCGKCGAIRVDGQLGLEKTPEEYVAKMVEVFREVRRVLRDDGTLFLNLGDSYATGGVCSPGIKPKDLVGIPWRVAFALQADGWYLRQDIIWAKPNPMPESVTDRCTKSHEYVFLLSKSARYFYDADAVKEAGTGRNWMASGGNLVGKGVHKCGDGYRDNQDGKSGFATGRNRRSVWHISTRPYKGAHFATFPPALVDPCVKAGTSEYGACAECGSPWSRIVSKARRATRPGADTKVSQAEGGLGGKDRSLVIGNRDPQRHVTEAKTEGWRKTCKCETTETRPCVVLDPFGGSGTTGRVASDLGRSSILCELNADYIELIRKRMTEPSKPVKKKRQSSVSQLPVNS